MPRPPAARRGSMPSHDARPDVDERASAGDDPHQRTGDQRCRPGEPRRLWPRSGQHSRHEEDEHGTKEIPRHAGQPQEHAGDDQLHDANPRRANRRPIACLRPTTARPVPQSTARPTQPRRLRTADVRFVPRPRSGRKSGFDIGHDAQPGAPPRATRRAVGGHRTPTAPRTAASTRAPIDIRPAQVDRVHRGRLRQTSPARSAPQATAALATATMSSTTG